MTAVLENEMTRVVINEEGAEVSSFILKEENLEYIWNGDPEFWGRQAPVLFPFVGRLKDDTYSYQGKSYPMSQHGFARDKVFILEEITESTAVFLLTSDAETLKVYPFEFELRIRYDLNEKSLTVGYEVTTQSDEMYFGIGGHPAFNVPLVEDTKFGSYYVHFAPSKSRFLLPLKGPYVNLEEKTLAQTNTSIQLNRELFKNDAMILETKGENAFSILSDKTKHGITLFYENLPFVGIWSPYEKEAPFICIEPWAGIADTTDATGNIEEKMGMNHLLKGEVFTGQYMITIK